MRCVKKRGYCEFGCPRESLDEALRDACQVWGKWDLCTTCAGQISMQMAAEMALRDGVPLDVFVEVAKEMYVFLTAFVQREQRRGEFS